MTPLDLEEPDLTAKQIEAFKNAPEELDRSIFEDLYYTRNEAEMVDALKTAGFDPTLIGYGDSEASNAVEESSTKSEDPTDNF